MTPVLDGIHHLKFPVSDLDASIDWFRRALGGEHSGALDHFDHSGSRFAVIMTLPGVAAPVELRLAPETARAMAGYDPVTFGVADRAALQEWIERLDCAGIEHSPVINGFAGQLITMATPDGVMIRLYTALPEDLSTIDMDPAEVDLTSPWVTGKG